MRSWSRTWTTAVVSTVASTLVLAGCGAEKAPQPASGAGSVVEPVAVTYDGGIYVLDGKTLEVKADVKLAGFNRLNPAGDDKHLMVSTSSGFRVLDAARGELTDIEFPGAEPGHVVRHAGRTVLFTDATGEVRVLDPATLGSAERTVETYKTAEPHHGVAIELANGELVVTLGNKDKRVGIAVLDEDRKEIARNEDCPGVHGEAAAKDEVVVIGCQNGVLIYRNGAITKVQSPTEYGRIGNQAGSDHSAIVLGDYKQDADAELERPTGISLIDTTTGALKLVDIGASYTFRSLARGPQGEALVLGTDGEIHVIDPVKAEVTRTIPVTDTWQEPLEWQQPRPAIFARGGTVYVSDPNKQQVHRIDLAAGTVTATASLAQKPNELSGVTT
ncbi:zinc metallochaperone AztD [Actinosynnema sp. NPDC023794]